VLLLGPRLRGDERIGGPRADGEDS